MNFKKFTIDALRTESVPDVINTNAELFAGLQSSVLNLIDCFDLIKKNMFYGKPIDAERFFARLTIAESTISGMRDSLRENADLVNVTTAQNIDPRELHGILGLFTEAGELLELVDLSDTNVDPLKIADELGDAMWYTAILAHKVDIDMEEQILEGVIAKLRKRFPDKFDAALATVRDKEAELAETSAVTGIADVSKEPLTEGKTVAAKKPVNKGGRPRKKPPIKKTGE